MGHPYYYLIASLPMLEFGMKSPISYAEFFTRFREQLSGPDIEIIKRVEIAPHEETGYSSVTLKEWNIFDTTLRNEIARSRAGKYAKDPAQYIRGEGYPDPFISGFLQWVDSLDSPLEAELSLDRMRWMKIEELEKGHYFDIDYLITYALKLLILERWERINSGNGMEALRGLVEKETS